MNWHLPRSIKQILNFILDLLLLLTGTFTLFGGYIVWFILPRGMGTHGSYWCRRAGRGGQGNSQNFLGLVRYQWIDLHNWVAVGFLCLILIHILIHWKWIVETTKRISTHLRRSAQKVLEMYGSFAVLLILFIFECISGLVLWLALPRGVVDYNNMVAGIGRTFWGLQRNVWADLHGWVAVAILSIIVIHILLNWNWVLGVIRRFLRVSGSSST